MWYTVFEVTGKGFFPTDMLRRDCCFPESTSDVEEMAFGTGEMRTVRMVTHHSTKANPGLTPDRWRSFGWELRLVRTGRSTR